jgi:hypothetical protein
MIDMLSFFADEMVTASWIAGAAGAYVNGEWSASYAAPALIQIVYPQPLTQDELQQLPEGERYRNLVQTWTTAAVNVRSGTTDTDKITYDGVTYYVHQVEDRVFPGNFKRVVMRERTADE